MAALLVQIEVSEAGLNAARDELRVFLEHTSDAHDERSALTYVVIRKLIDRLNDAARQREKEARKNAPTPPTIRELRRRQAA